MEKIWEARVKGGIQELHLCWEMGKGDLLYIPGLYQFVVYINGTFKGGGDEAEKVVQKVTSCENWYLLATPKEPKLGTLKHFNKDPLSGLYGVPPSPFLPLYMERKTENLKPTGIALKRLRMP